MIGALPPLHPPAYTLTEDLRELSEPASIRRPAPDELAREELLLRKLGPRGWGRVHHFRNYYQSGWGEQRGQILSPKALDAFSRFLEAVEIPQRITRGLANRILPVLKRHHAPAPD